MREIAVETFVIRFWISKGKGKQEI